MIKVAFIDGGWFDPVSCGIPPLEFEGHVEEVDHSWHEVTRISITSEPATHSMDVTELLDKAMKAHQPRKTSSCPKQEYVFNL
ncbi:hypothetical protein [Telluribacter sp.]|uniref:hypothetical protein n=1 Tax=Telluribacter sp. TaxID=1978767 RepID=UPI002E14CE74|nr:hypothetical protein [Telluribacter sp.]